VDLDHPVTDGSFKLFDTAASGGLSLQEQLRRERMRLFTSGIAAYEWSAKNSATQKMIVPLDGKVILYEEGGADKVRVVYDGSVGDAVDPHLSPDGTAVAFVVNDDLYAMQIPAADATEATVPTRLTFNGAKKGVTCGLADYLAQEEMDRCVRVCCATMISRCDLMLALYATVAQCCSDLRVVPI
jgi:dipeptidyl-peptidase-4